MERWAYLGPAGTFTEQAARQLAVAAPEGAVELVPAESVPAALQLVRDGDVAAAVVPLENSVEGIVALTQDELIHGAPLRIAAEAEVRIRFDLAVRPGTTREAVRSIGSHPHGHAQVRERLARELPGHEAVITGSTAAAAAAVAAGELDAAVCAPVAGERYGLQPLLTDIGARTGAVTRFVQVRALLPGFAPDDPAAAAGPPTGADRSSLVVTVPNVPGSLVALLTRIAERGINLTRIESRPTREVMGEYLFILDADGHPSQSAVADLVAQLQGDGSLLRLLGSYPRSPGPV